MQKNIAGQKIQLFAFDATTNVPKAGDAANITAYVSKDHGAVTVLGDTSATEMDATNAPGVYVFDLTQGETNADELTFSAKSATANIKIVPRFISTNPPSFTASVAQTGDSYAVVNSGTFGNSALKTLIDAVDDFVDTEITDIRNRLPAALTVDGLMKSDTLRVGGTLQTAGDIYALSVTIATYVDTEVATIVTQTSAASLRAAMGLASANLDTQLSGIQADADNIQTRIPAALTGGGNMKSDPQAINGDATSAANLAKTTRAIGRGTVNAGATTTSIPTSAFTPAGVDIDQFKDRVITFDADTATTALRGQSAAITTNTGAAAPTLTVTALTRAPASGDTFSVT